MGSTALRLAATVLLLLPGGAAAQQQRVKFEITASAPLNEAGVRQPVLRTPGLLRDSRWREAIENSFPLRLRLRVEIWRVRTDWFDAQERNFAFEVLIQYEPLTDEYSRTLIFGGSPREIRRFTTLVDLERSLERENVVNIRPSGVGEYYFSGSLQIQVLTDDEMEELERFLQGEPTPRDRQNPGPSIGRSARRLLLRFGGLPYQELEARSERFEVRPPPP